MKILKEEIERIFKHNYRNYMVAKRYLKMDIIEYIDISEQYGLYVIDAYIDSYSGEHRCQIKIDKYDNIVDFECDCYYSLPYEPCAHIGAVLLFLETQTITSIPCHIDFKEVRQKQLDEYYLKLSRKTTQSLIKQYQSVINEDIEIDTYMDLKIIALADIRNGEITLNYKLGNEKLYVIKNIHTFLHAIQNHEKISYGKNLTFTHDKERFDQSSQKQIEFMQNAINYNRYGNGFYATRTLDIISETIDDYFDLYSQLNSQYTNIEFSKTDIDKIPMNVTKEEDFYVFNLELDTDYLIEGNKHWYFYDKQNYILHRFKENLSKDCQPILANITSEKNLKVHNKDIKDFCKYVYSQIRNYLNIDETIFSDYIIEENMYCTYIDVDEDGNIISEVFNKGTEQNIPINLNEPANIKEQKILNIFNHFDALYSNQKNQAIIQDHKDLGYKYIKSGLPILERISEVFVSDAISNMEKPNHIQMHVGVKIENDLLKVDLESINIPRDEIFDVLKNYRRKKKYHRLKNGEMLNLQSDSLEQMDHLFNELQIKEKDLQKNTIEIDPYRAFLLEQASKEENDIVIHRDSTFNQLIENVKNISSQKYQVPECYQNILRDYQVDGFKWLKTMSDYGFGGILADDMGLGKTLQIITLLEDALLNDTKQTSIVVCPASLILNWQDEIHKFSNNLKCLCVSGSLSTRKKQIETINDYDVIVTSYDYMRKDYELYLNTMFNYIIIDEAQYIKNHTTKNAFSIKQLKGKHRFALTGTPIENSLAELWSIFDFLMPNYLYNYHYFKSNYETDIVKNKDEHKQARLKQMVEPFILRRNKKEVLEELPDKVETINTIEFNKEEQKLYLANLAQINVELQEKLQVESNIDKFAILAMMTRLRQICCDPRLIYENIKEPSSKIKYCVDLMTLAKENNQKVLLFSSFTSTLDLIETELKNNHISYYKLTGNTPKETRRELVTQFQNDETTVFLISLKAGGTGLNLTAAQIVIHFDPWWNMSAQNQATDRAYRIGQTKNVMVHKLIMKDSIEEKIMQLQEMKMNLADTFVESNQGSITSMSKDEILDLFK